MTRHDGLFSIAADILEELIHIWPERHHNEQLVGTAQRLTHLTHGLVRRIRARSRHDVTQGVPGKVSLLKT